MKYKDGITVFLLILLAIIVLYAFTYKEPSFYSGGIVLGDRNITNYEGAFKLGDAKAVAIVMDARNASQQGRVKVFECGVGFASSLGLLNKSVKNYALEDELCIKPDMNKTSLGECNDLIKQQSDYIIFLKGSKNSTKVQYYEDHVYIEVPENNERECGIK